MKAKIAVCTRAWLIVSPTLLFQRARLAGIALQRVGMCVCVSEGQTGAGSDEQHDGAEELHRQQAALDADESRATGDIV